jgi:adenosylcobinamide kinase/adenosylcobinamide-phosphate guanylyltransferase
MGKIVFVLGGARSGKSAWAEERALERERAGASVVYLATCEHRPEDVEMSDRIARHRSHRPSTWRTTEEAYEIEEQASALVAGDVMLVDCLSLWVSNLLLETPEQGEVGTAEAVLGRVRKFLHAARRSLGDVILVSNETGCGVVPPSRLGRLYRDILGWANQEAAKVADEVWFLVAGLPQRLK